MKRLKFKRIFAIILITMCISYILPISFVSASNPTTNPNFSFEDYDSYGSGVGNNSIHADRIAKSAMGLGIKIIRIVATGVSIVMLSYIGIKYMMAAPSEKAEFKKSASIYILGAILIFAAGNILTIITKFATSNIATS